VLILVTANNGIGLETIGNLSYPSSGTRNFKDFDSNCSPQHEPKQHL
jgi:hypothetical protein